MNVCLVLVNMTKSEKQKLKRKQNTHNAILHLGGKCKHCSLAYTSKNAIVFDFHHLDPTTKSFKLASKTNTTPEKFMAEVNKCILLCSNCHRLLHENERLSST